jgi:AraC-like DNA-binding protein
LPDIREAVTIMKNETVKGNVNGVSIRLALPEDRVPSVGSFCEIHYHDEIEMLTVERGMMLITVYDKQYFVKGGETVFINSRVPHSTLMVEEGETGLLQLRERDFIDYELTKITKYSVRFQSQLSHPIAVFSDPEIFSLMNEIYREYREQDRSYEMFMKSYIYKLLGILYRRDVLSDAETLYNRKEVQKILPVLSYVNANYADDLTLEEVSARLGFDHSYFCRVFKSATGATFTEYLNYVRVCKAERMLQHSDDSIISISEAVGFSSVSYFNRVFKKYRNCSPRAFRAMICYKM